MADEKPIIELEDVWKVYQMGEVEVEALRGLSLEVYKGEFLSVMGPSGSGKSTAMNMIGCLDVPTSGSIELDGQDISELHESDLAQIRGRKIGFVFQQFNLINNLTAKENIMLPMTFQGFTEKKRRERAEELLKKVGLGARENHRPNELSGGEKQRVATARALANEPEVVLADEPTGNLDSKTGEKIMELFTDLHEEKGITMILVSHERSVAEYAERIEHLKDGKIFRTENKNKSRVEK